MAKLAIASRVPTGLRRRLRSWFVAHTYLTIQSADQTCGFAVFGSRESAARLSRIFLGSNLVVSARRWRMATLDKSVSRLASKLGIVHMDGPMLPNVCSEFGLRWPRAVAFETDVLASEQQFVKALGRSAREDVRRALKLNLSPVIVRDPLWSQQFHDDFHQKSIFSRHGATGFVISVNDSARLVGDLRGEFLCLQDGTSVEGAALCGVDGDRYRMYHLGWRSGDPALLRKGVAAALYVHAMRRARELGLRKVHLGHSPAYLESGSFRYKMKWNARLLPVGGYLPIHRLFLNPWHPSAQGLLGRVSLVTIDEAGQFQIHSAKAPCRDLLGNAFGASVVRWHQLAPDREKRGASGGPETYALAYHLHTLNQRETSSG